MACNCATDEYIKSLYKKYGVNSVSKNSKMTLEDKVRFYLRKLTVVMTLVVAIPMLALYIIHNRVFGDGKISFTKFFGLKPISVEEYVRKQQELQNKN